MIPTKRMLWLALIPPGLIVLGLGSATAVYLAWIALGVLALAFVLDGYLAGSRPRLHLERSCPLQLHVDQTHCIAWRVENRSSFPVQLRMSDTLPRGATTNRDVLAVPLVPRSRVSIEYELTPTERGDCSFGDLVYRVLGPWGLA